MKKFTYALLMLFAVQLGFSQNKLWKGYFSFREIKDLSESTTKVVAGSENALFSKNLTSGQITTTTTVDGLSGETITAIYHSPTYKKTIIGYATGLMIVVNEVDGSVLNVVDIINKTLPPTIKRINHFMEYDGKVYISCDYGVSEYNLATLVFGDTFFIGDNAAQIAVKQTAVFQGRIYAATRYYGIRSADINNPNLNDFAQWTTVAGGAWLGVEAFGDYLMATNDAGSLQRWNGTTFGAHVQLQQVPVDLRKSGTNLIVTTANFVYIYDAALLQIRLLNSNEIPEIAATFTCATLINNTIYIGTLDDGLQSTTLTPGPFVDMTPDGPLRNNIFAMTSAGANLWSVFGDYDIFFNPYPLDYYGVSKYAPTGWFNIPYQDIEAAVGHEVTSMVRVAANPANPNDVYISSYHSGLLKFENDVPVLLYDPNNSSLEAPASGTLRINGSAYDNQGNLWVTNNYVNRFLKVKRADGQWQEGPDLGTLFQSISEMIFGRMTIDKNGTKWIATRDKGVIGFNENYGNLAKAITDEPGNLPSVQVSIAVADNRNQLWIGTRKGLRVLSSVDSFLSGGDLEAESIIIIEDNLAQELLYEQSVTDIVVDGSNNKWLATADSGVFYVSPNGQQTIYHFTKDNSPLPSNSVNDVEINGITGEVFIATDKGMVSFKGTATSAADNLNNVYVYPNPVRPGYAGTVKVSGLLDKANVKIADIEGNLVYETISEGGTIEWDTTAFGKYKVASGVYMIFVSAEDGGETKVKKVMIVR
ncbi:type IX secretion system anionic LPS delivery protein PorZ [Flavobacterium caeni]|nr:T9SS type A sorting domain-containing protein [Flavobacterium caeni]